MKNIFITFIIALSAMIISCGPNKEQQKKNTNEDSIRKVDSITKILIGTWNKGNGYSIRITKTEKLFTVHYGNNSEGEKAAAYTLDGQILKPVDSNDSPVSLVEDGKLLFKGSVYTKGEGNSSSDYARETKKSPKSKTSSSAATSKNNTDEESNTSSVTSSAPAATELTIICDHTINLFNWPSNSANIIQGLANGQVCKLIKKGKQETLGGKTDYWYEVNADGSKGWVFGAYTSLHQ
ncbi:MAG: SH3 domain-containing protein [Bacteroidales bacterium]|jgi:hypothetical protein